MLHSALPAMRLSSFLWNALFVLLVVLGAAAGSQLVFQFPERLPAIFEFDPALLEDLEMPENLPLGERPEVTEVAMPRWLLPVLGGLVLAGIAALIARHLWRKRGQLKALPVEDVVEPVPDVIVQFAKADLVDAVTRAQARMAEARNPSDAVVAGWLAFEDVAATRGWVRAPHETTTEFTGRLLASSDAPPAPVGVLRGLYQQVRFGARTPTVDDVAAAHDALGQIAGHLDALPDESEKQAAAFDNVFVNLPTRPRRGSPNPIIDTSDRDIISGVKRNKWGED